MTQEEEKLFNVSKILQRLDENFDVKGYDKNLRSLKSNICIEQDGFLSSERKEYLMTNPDIAEEKVVSLSREEKLGTRKEAMKSGKVSVLEDGFKKFSDNESSFASVARAGQHPANSTLSSKSKAELRKERREKQEAQRAAKEAPMRGNLLESKSKAAIGKASYDKQSSHHSERSMKRVITRKEERHLPLLEHLFTQNEAISILKKTFVIHPSVRSAGCRMQYGTVDGCLCRVISTLSALSNLVEDYVTPPSCDLSRDLCIQLSANVAFLNSCRPLLEPMNNAIRFLRREVNEISHSLSDSEAKAEILNAIDMYIHQNIVLASQTIVHNALEFLEEGDVVLTFGFSALVYETMKAAVKIKDNLSIIVIGVPCSTLDTEFLTNYSLLGITVYYRILPDIMHIISKVTKVLIEAEAVVLNGALIGPCGLAGLCLVASSHAVPVIALSHTFKFCNIDLTDSLVVNELGDTSLIVDCPSSTYSKLLASWRENHSLNVVNLVYDVTPASLVTVLVTERNNLPTSVVPVIIKRNYADILGFD